MKLKISTNIQMLQLTKSLKYSLYQFLLLKWTKNLEIIMNNVYLIQILQMKKVF